MRPVITSVLKNGFRVYSQYDSTNSTNLCGICVKVGSSSDPPQFYGLAHMLEHLIFRKTKTHSLREVLLQSHRLGGISSFDIRTDRISTFFGTPNLPRRYNVKDYFSLIADLIRNFKVDLTGLRTEKGAIHPEIFLMGEDSAPDEIEDVLYESVYRRNPIRNRVAGYIATVKPIPPSRITNFYNKYYVASNMAAIILGPKHLEAVEMAKEFFGDMPLCKAPDRFKDYVPLDQALPVFDMTKTVIQERPGIHQAHLAIGFPMKVLTKEAPLAELLAKVLEFRLWVKLREENQDFDGGAYRVSVYFDRSKLHSILIVKTAISSSRVDAATEIITGELQKIRNELVENDLFEASKTALLNNRWADFGDGGALCDLITGAFVNDDEELRGFHNYSKILRRVGSKRAMSLANEHINPQNYFRVVIKPA